MKKTLAAIALLLLFFWGFWMHFYQLTSWPEQPERMIRVHLEGSVRTPGVYTLSESARLAELIEEAGGLMEDADAERLNLAQRLIDGEKIVVYPKREEEESSDASWESHRLPMDLESWLAVPGVGPATAQNILDYLQAHPSASIDELIHVSGIGPVKHAGIKEYFGE